MIIGVHFKASCGKVDKGSNFNHGLHFCKDLLHHHFLLDYDAILRMNQKVFKKPSIRTNRLQLLSPNQLSEQ